MEGGSFETCGSRFGAAHARPKQLQPLQGWRAVPLPIVVLASALRSFGVGVCSTSTVLND
eukprot:2578029-Pyramimonas_sp.AAC.1